MKDLDDRQYERVARRLDGEEISLTAEEQALVEEMGRLEAGLGTRLDTALPAGVASRLDGRLEDALRHGRGVRLWLRPAGMLALAAAVLLAVGVGLWGLLPGGPQGTPDIPGQYALPDNVDPDVVRALLAGAEDSGLDWLEDEVGKLEMETVVTSVSVDAAEVEMDALERDLGEMLNEDSKPFLPEI